MQGTATLNLKYIAINFIWVGVQLKPLKVYKMQPFNT